MSNRLTALAAFVLAACAAPAAGPIQEAAAAPASFEEAERAATKAARAGTNTYAESCPAIRKKFLATAPTTRWDERIKAAGSRDRAALGHTETRVQPGAIWPKSAKAKSAACVLIFDLDKSGAPTRIEAACSDPDYEAAAVSSMAAARFRLTSASGAKLARTGHLYPMEFCRDA